MGSQINCCKSVNNDVIEKEGKKVVQFIYDIQEPQTQNKNKEDYSSNGGSKQTLREGILEKENKKINNDLEERLEIRLSQSLNQADLQEDQDKQKQKKKRKKPQRNQKYNISQSNCNILQVSDILTNSSITNSEKQQLNSRQYSRNFLGSFRSVRKIEGSVQSSYQIIKKLGEGGYGQVMLAKNNENGEMRAIKSIDIRDTKQYQQIEMEIEILKKIDHPNIVKLFEVFVDSKKIHLVQELVMGGELFERILEIQSFNEEDAKQIMKQVLQAIQYCHSLNIVHRDLKPENILLQSKYPNNIIKVIDFGTSTLFKEGSKLKDVSGTSYYIAPEVLRGSYDQKCDIWSCGVILYILLCGEPPFNGKNDEEIIKKVVKGELTFSQKE